MFCAVCTAGTRNPNRALAFSGLSGMHYNLILVISPRMTSRERDPSLSFLVISYSPASTSFFGSTVLKGYVHIYMW